jgi:hypothetical protein
VCKCMLQGRSCPCVWAPAGGRVHQCSWLCSARPTKSRSSKSPDHAASNRSESKGSDWSALKSRSNEATSVAVGEPAAACLLSVSSTSRLTSAERAQEMLNLILAPHVWSREPDQGAARARRQAPSGNISGSPGSISRALTAAVSPKGSRHA